MNQVDQVGFSCAACGKQFRWKPELAGKKVACKCGVTVRVPAQAGEVAQAATAVRAAANAPGLAAAGRSADVPHRSSAPAGHAPPPPPPKSESDGDFDFDGLYALAADAEKSAPAEDTAYRCPYCQSDMVPGSLLCTGCGVDLQTGRRAAAAVAPPAPAARGGKPGKSGKSAGVSTVAAAGAAQAGAVALPWGVRPRVQTDSVGTRGFTADNLIYEGSKFRSLYLPLILIAVGLVFYVGQFALAEKDQQFAVGAWVVFIGLNFALDAILIFAALIFAVKVFDMGFGALGPALLKIGAIAIGPGAIGEILIRSLAEPMGALGAIITGSVVAIVMYYALIKVLFQLDLAETIRLTGIIYFLRRWVKFYLMMGLISVFMSGGAGGADDDDDYGSEDESPSIMVGAMESALDGGAPPPKVEKELPPEDERVVGHFMELGWKEHGWVPRLASESQHLTVQFEAEAKARALSPEAKAKIIADVDAARAKENLISMLAAEAMQKVQETHPDYSNYDAARDGVVVKVEAMSPAEQDAERKRLNEKAKVDRARFRKEYAAERAAEVAKEKAAAAADGFDDSTVGNENLGLGEDDEEMDEDMEDEDMADDAPSPAPSPAVTGDGLE